MKILLVTRGYFLNKPDKYFRPEYNGIKICPKIAGGFGWFWEKALKELGHQVESFIYYRNPTLDSRGEINLFIHSWKSSLPVIKSLPAHLMNKRLIKLSLDYKPELILIDAGELIYPETLFEIKQRTKAKIVNWLWDDPIMQGWKNVIKSLPIYDFIFVFDPEYIPKFKELGAIKIDYLPCACDPDIHRTYQLSEEERKKLGNDLCFVGAITDKRIEILQKLTEFDLGIWAWNPAKLKNTASLFNRYRGIAWGELMSKIFNAAKIVLNIHHPQTISGINLKTFEIAGSGAFQLVDDKKEVARLFPEQEIVSYRNIDELKERISYYLANPQERQIKARKAQQRAYQEHTYKHRLSALISRAEKLL